LVSPFLPTQFLCSCTLCTSELVTSEVFTAERTMVWFFWIMAPCRLVGRCRSFGETYCLHLHG
jgi:hypothetical protein